MLRFFKIPGKFCGKICIYLYQGILFSPCLSVGVHLKNKRLDLSNDAYVNFLGVFFCFNFSGFLYKSICCGYPFELHRLVDGCAIS